MATSNRPVALRSALLIASVVLAVGLCAWLAPRLQSDSSLAASSLLDDDTRGAFEDFQQHFGADEVLLVTLTDRGERPLFNRGSLLALREIEAALREGGADAVEDVVSLVSLEDFSVRKVFGQAVPTPPRKLIPESLEVDAKAEAALRTDRFLSTGILSDDGRTTALWVLLRPELRDRSDYLERVEAVAKRLPRQFEGRPDLRVRITGFPLLRRALAQEFLAHGLLIGLAALLAIALAAALLGVRRAAILAFVVGVTWTSALLLLLAVLLGRRLHIYTPNLIPLLIATSSALLFHVGLRAPRKDVKGHVWVIAFWSTVTTAIGFLCLAPSPLPALSAFGIEAAVGSLLAFLSVAIALRLMPGALVSARYRYLPNGLPPRAKALALIALFSMGLPIFLLDTNRLGSVGDLAGYLPKSHILAQETREARDAMQALLGLEIVMRLPVEGNRARVLDEDFLLGIEGFEEAIKAAAGDDMPRLFGAGAMLKYLGTRIDTGASGETRRWAIDAEVVQFARRFLLEPFIRAGQRGLSESAIVKALAERLGQILSIDGKRLRWHARIAEPSPAEILALERRLSPVLKREAERLGAISASVTGSALVFAKTTEAVLAIQVQSLTLGAMGLSVLLLLVLRSLGLGLLAVFASAAAILATINVLWVFRADLNLYTAVLTATLLGVIVDDTLHLIAAWSSAKGSARWRTALALSRVGPPIFASSIGLAVALSTFALSPLPFYRQFAATGVLCIALTLAYDFLLVTAVLRRNRDHSRSLGSLKT